MNMCVGLGHCITSGFNTYIATPTILEPWHSHGSTELPIPQHVKKTYRTCVNDCQIAVYIYSNLFSFQISTCILITESSDRMVGVAIYVLKPEVMQ